MELKHENRSFLASQAKWKRCDKAGSHVSHTIFGGYVIHRHGRAPAFYCVTPLEGTHEDSQRFAEKYSSYTDGTDLLSAVGSHQCAFALPSELADDMPQRRACLHAATAEGMSLLITRIDNARWRN